MIGEPHAYIASAPAGRLGKYRGRFLVVLFFVCFKSIDFVSETKFGVGVRTWNSFAGNVVMSLSNVFYVDVLKLAHCQKAQALHLGNFGPRIIAAANVVLGA